MLLVGLAIRMVVVAIAYPLQLDPRLDHQEFAYEMGKVAKAIALGQGYSSPLYGPTGPTAWVPPVYTYLLAWTFKIFGIYTAASAIVMLLLGSIFSVLTCLPVVAIGRRTMGQATGLWAGWAWVLFPFAIYFSGVRIWCYTLAALLIAWLFLLTLELETAPGYRKWIVFGVVGGVTVLTLPTILASLPFLTLWIIYSRRRRGSAWFWRAAVATLIVIAIMSPWVIRNYMVFHRFIPVRDNFWVEFRLGNNETNVLESDFEHPATNGAEWQKFQRLGEVGYEQERKERSLEFLRAHPGHFAWTTVRHTIFFWTGYWSLDRKYLEDEPTAIPNLFFVALMTILMLKGLRDTFRARSPAAWPHTWILLSFPVVYYITHSKMDYRHPIEPMIVVLCVAAFTGHWDHRSAKGKTEPDEICVAAR
jgi:4-amino-4-deoxy-L-arabinose transferase-like glycosyltransferase